MTFFKNKTSGTEKEAQSGAATERKKALFEQLRKAEVAAIRVLAAQVLPDVRYEIKQAGLPKEDVEEVLNDAIVITLTAIRNGKFQFMDYHSATYTKGVARKLIANRSRTQKPNSELFESMGGQSDLTPENYVGDKERKAVVRELLSQLGEDCRKVLLLKYFEHLKDKEVVLEKMTPYSTVASLKSKRGQCLKKLAELARKAGITEVF